MKTLSLFFGRHTDVALVALVMGVLIVLFAPIPAGLLDFLILANFSFAFLVLLLTFYVAKPVEFSTFPSLLLIATLFRLALNVAATRLILSEANAGRVIGAIGSYVVGGNYVIGLIVFLILIVVQYVVVTNGAQRVSEVAARFTLDSMPGQQMSIDADLNMGFIDQAEAQRRRKRLEKEAAFYGAMDGASKFVKGDAVAGILILLINIIGGIVIGIMQLGMRWGDALQSYTLLTIGDGIVTQVPALVIAVGTGILVTRSSSDSNLSQEVFRQVTAFPKTMLLVSAVLIFIMAVPGIPVVPALVISGAMLVGAWLAYRSSSLAVNSEHQKETSDREDGSEESSSEDPYGILSVDPVEIHVDSHWAKRLASPESLLLERVGNFRKQHALDLGLVLPKIRFKDAPKAQAGRYEIHIDGVIAGRGEMRAEHLLAIHPAGDLKAIPGEATRDPTYGLPALWIDPKYREMAAKARFTLVDAETILLTHLTEVLRRESATLLTRAETDRLLSRARQMHPTLVEELIPTVLTVSDVQRVLQGLLKEKVNIRNIEAILETLADVGRQSKDVGVLIERVRQRLAPAICQSLMADANVIQVLTLDPATEAQLLQEIRGAEANQQWSFDPKMAELLISKLVTQCERMMKSNLLPVLLCSPDLRRHIRTLSERVLPHLRVLSMSEIPRTVELKSFGVVRN